MPTTFNVIFLGVFPDIDTIEGNDTAEAAAALVGTTVGGFGDALAGRFQQLTVGDLATRYNSDFNTYYDQNDPTPETFRINGGPDQGFDASVVYDATITYLDGSTAEITAVVFQDVDGNTYLAPEFEDNADQAALEAGPLLSITLDALTDNVNSYAGMTGNRQAFDFVPCFVAGTRLATPMGLRAIETLEVGDLVMTQDHGFEPIRWIGRTTVAAQGTLTPIRIRAGALGQGLPTRDLLVSPQHRMLLRSRIAERMTGAREVLVPAVKLLDLPGVERATDLEHVTYLHLMFDQHEIVFAEGAPTESLLPGRQALAALGPEAIRELRVLFPELEAMGQTPARLIPQGRVQRRLVWRHLANEKALLRD